VKQIGLSSLFAFIKRAANSGCQLVWPEWLDDQPYVLIDHTVLHNGVPGVTGHEQHGVLRCH
jgi:hypothetical protein